MESRKQGFSSKGTSINKNKLPAVYSRVTFSGKDVVLDYGCGKYTDHIRQALPTSTRYLPFDLFNQPEGVNVASMAAVEDAIKAGKNVAVVCSNVLNVIDSDDAVRDVAAAIVDIVTRSHGVAYVTVYEGDKSGRGRQTGPDAWQRNQRTADYTELFPGSYVKNSVIYYEMH